MNQVSYTIAEPSFFLLVVNRTHIEIFQKFQNIMARIVWKFSFFLYTSNDDSSFWKKCSFGLKRLILSKKYQ